MRGARKKRGGKDKKAPVLNIAVTSETWNLIKDFFNGEPSANNRVQTFAYELSSQTKIVQNTAEKGHADFYYIHTATQNVKLSRSSYLEKNRIDEKKI